MIDLLSPRCQDVCEYWSLAVTRLLWNQWKLLDAQYAAGIELLDTVAGGPAGAALAKQTLEQYALERVRKGLSPPREIYEVHNRSRIDWSRFPDWARPIDPEVFEGCGHEG
jgi:hypothetical protein